MTTVVGIDFSLSCSGITRAVISGDGPPSISVRRVESSPPKRIVGTTGKPYVPLGVRSQRLRTIAGKITELCAGADLVLIEGPSYASDSGAAHDRAGTWWLIVARLTGAGLNVVEVPPTVLKTYALGKGAGKGTGKDDVLTAVIRNYPGVVFSGNDEADSLVLAAIGCRFVKHPIDQLPQTHTRALSSVQWTPTR